MSKEIRIGMVGLDTSHSVAFTKCLQAPDCPPEIKVEGARVVTCMRFATPFLNEEGLDNRQKQLEEWGVKVTRDFDEAVADCDAIALEINDPAYHLEYFKKCAGLGKPIFLDKPLADNIRNGRDICNMAKEAKLRVFSASSLRFVPEMEKVTSTVAEPLYGYTFGPLGKAPAGSSIVWYGVHAFEMLQRMMGMGARSVFTKGDNTGVVSVVEYENNRRGVVELTQGAYVYGGCLRSAKEAAPFVASTGRLYSDLLVKMVAFFNGAEPAATMEDTLEIMAMLDAAERSLQSGKSEVL